MRIHKMDWSELLPKLKIALRNNKTKVMEVDHRIMALSGRTNRTVSIKKIIIVTNRIQKARVSCIKEN